MANHDYVANRALGALDKELKRAEQDGLRLWALRRSGVCTLEQEQRLRARYRGVCRARLEAALNGLPTGEDVSA